MRGHREDDACRVAVHPTLRWAEQVLAYLTAHDGVGPLGILRLAILRGSGVGTSTRAQTSQQQTGPRSIVRGGKVAWSHRPSLKPVTGSDAICVLGSGMI